MDYLTEIALLQDSLRRTLYLRPDNRNRLEALEIHEHETGPKVARVTGSRVKNGSLRKALRSLTSSFKH